MEKVNTIGKGDRARLNVLLEPVYELGNKIVCEYKSDGISKEISFYADELKDAPEVRGKLTLSKDLIIEEIFEKRIICKIEGTNRELALPRRDLEILEVEETLVDM